MQAIAAAQRAAGAAESTANASVQQLSTQLQEQTAENSKLREQLAAAHAGLLRVPAIHQPQISPIEQYGVHSPGLV
jgi:hypothetical protein